MDPDKQHEQYDDGDEIFADMAPLGLLALLLSAVIAVLAVYYLLEDFL